MAPTSIRSVLGSVKDQTSIGIAKVSSNVSPTLDVLVVKATSHDDAPAEERHVREILSRTSYSLPHVAACVAAVSRRLGRTKDWVVALKALALVHRLLSDGNPAFQREVLHGTRRGARLLNMSDFRDEAHAHSWDQSAFVRAYAMYLDQRLECALYESKYKGAAAAVEGGSEGGDRRRRSHSYDRSYHSDDYRYDGGYDDRRRASSYDEPPPPRDERRRYHSNSPPARTTSDAGNNGDPASNNSKPPTPTAVPPEQVLGKMHQLQQLLDRFLACRPTGRAKNTRMVLLALYPVLSESFLIYADLCKSLAAILDRFFDLEYRDCVKALDAYARAARQIDELVAFYGWCKDVGVARSSEYPEVKKITNELLDTLEEFVREKAKGGSSTPAPAKQPEPPVAAEPEEEEPVVEDFNGIKALPPPEGFEEPKPAAAEEKKPQETGDLVDLREDTSITADDQGNRLALALFSGGTGFSSSNGDDSGITSAWQTPAAEPGKADWELALVETASNLAKQKASLAGGFDPVLLDGMYDQGVVNQHVSSTVTGGSASSVALPLPGLGRNAKPVLALPAPDGTVQTVGHDPFAASLAVPPPSYVQMAELEKKQQLLVQEQQVWQRYTMDGMQGQSSLTKLSAGYAYGAPPTVPVPVPAYGMPPVNATGGGYYYTSY